MTGYSAVAHYNSKGNNKQESLLNSRDTHLNLKYPGCGMCPEIFSSEFRHVAEFVSGPEGNRTPGLFVANEALSQN